MLYCPLRSPANSCSRLPGGSLKSCISVEPWIWIIFLLAVRCISGGSFFENCPSHIFFVSESAKETITTYSSECHHWCQAPINTHMQVFFRTPLFRLTFCGYGKLREAQCVCSAARRGAYFFLPALSSHERPACRQAGTRG